MRSFRVIVYANLVECFEEKEISRVDYTARISGGERLQYKVIVSQKGGKVMFGRDRGAHYCHYHAKNIDLDYSFVALPLKSG
jgi:hypothetical protein